MICTIFINSITTCIVNSKTARILEYCSQLANSIYFFFIIVYMSKEYSSPASHILTLFAIWSDYLRACKEINRQAYDSAEESFQSGMYLFICCGP